MNNKVVFGQYYNANSWIHRLDPRTKIISIFILIISLFLINNLEALAIALGLTLIIISTSKVPIMKFLNSLKMMAMLLFITVIFQVLFNKTGNSTVINLTLNILNSIIIIVLIVFYFLSKRFITKFRFLLLLITVFLIFFVQSYVNLTLPLINYQIEIYEAGIYTSLLILSRIIALIFISSLLTLTTKPTDLNNGLELVAAPLKLIGVKVSILSMMISIALRFIPTLLNEAEKILKAQASRGVDFKEGKFKEKVTQIISLLIPMFVISYKRASDLADAMEARGYIPGEPRTSINKLQYRFTDVITMSILVITISFLIFLKVTSSAL